MWWLYTAARRVPLVKIRSSHWLVMSPICHQALPNQRAPFWNGTQWKCHSIVALFTERLLFSRNFCRSNFKMAPVYKLSVLKFRKAHWKRSLYWQKGLKLKSTLTSMKNNSNSTKYNSKIVNIRTQYNFYTHHGEWNNKKDTILPQIKRDF